MFIWIITGSIGHLCRSALNHMKEHYNGHRCVKAVIRSRCMWPISLNSAINPLWPWSRRGLKLDWARPLLEPAPSDLFSLETEPGAEACPFICMCILLQSGSGYTAPLQSHVKQRFIMLHSGHFITVWWLACIYSVHFAVSLNNSPLNIILNKSEILCNKYIDILCNTDF